MIEGHVRTASIVYSLKEGARLTLTQALGNRLKMGRGGGRLAKARPTSKVLGKAGGEMAWPRRDLRAGWRRKRPTPGKAQ
jgi:hypothetical protein